MDGRQARGQRDTRPAGGGEGNKNGAPGRLRSPRRAELGEGDVDRVISRLAGRQLGNVERGQLLGAGVGRAAVDHWLRSGRLHRQFRNVYALGHTALPSFSREMAAVLSCGRGAALSHGSAAFVWGVRPAPADGLVHVTVLGRRVRDQPGIRIHRVRHLQRRDIRRVNGFPIISPARTLLDISPDLDSRELELALHELIATRQTTMAQVKGALAVYPRRRGTARLTKLVGSGGPLTLTKKGAEEKLFRTLRAAGLPLPRTNHRLGKWSVDLYWPQYRLVVEVDGLNFHSTLPNVERDHRKDVDLRRRAIDVMRFTGRQVSRELAMTLATIAWELGRREALRPRPTGS